MSSPAEEPMIERKPLIAIVDRLLRLLATDLLRASHERGHTQIRPAHDPVFATLPSQGARASDMAARAGITKQSMGEAIRDMVEMGLLEMTEDPSDRRAKLVTFTDAGMAVAQDGKRHMRELEQQWIAKFGEQEYETAREVLEGIVELMTPEP
ncbi:MAG TPA: MarR family winged helix-turn-helix transcriptional regulator [Nocardioides sp.]|nr:MarR family winged helix-turn-helix transcriptional regulator [Nocardioides sp.]